MPPSLPEAAVPVRLNRALGLWNLIFIGLVIVQPTASMGIYGVISNKAQRPRRHHHPHHESGFEVRGRGSLGAAPQKPRKTRGFSPWGHPWLARQHEGKQS